MSESQNHTPCSGMQILLIIEDAARAEKLKGILAAEGYVVSVAKGGADGLSMTRELKPSLVVCETGMAEMDGVELCRLVRQDPKIDNTPFILLSSHENPGNIIRALECGADNIIVKPLEENVLPKRIRQILSSRDAHKNERAGLEVETHIAGTTGFISSDRSQVLDLLLSTYETAEMIAVKEELATADERLKSSNELLSSIVQKTSDGILIVDNTGFVRYCNDAAKLLLNRSDKDLLNTQFGFPIESDSSVEIDILRTAGEQGVAEMRVDKTSWNGEEAYVVRLRDLTEKKRAEQEIARVHSMLLQQEKMAAIGHLAAGVAHEINNPMGFISSNLESLPNFLLKYARYIDELEFELGKLNSGRLPDQLTAVRQALKLDYVMTETGKMIEECREGTERVRQIVLDLKTFSHTAKVEAEETDINDCLDKTINVIKNELKYASVLKKEYGEIPRVSCNVQQISQVFMNLMINAVDAIKGKGDDLGQIMLRTWRDENNVFASISDTGCGILPEHIKTIFNPFFTTKDVGKGTGLGLSISAEIIRVHGGEISVSSKIGVGSTFVVRLPLHREIERSY